MVRELTEELTYWTVDRVEVAAWALEGAHSQWGQPRCQQCAGTAGQVQQVATTGRGAKVT